MQAKSRFIVAAFIPTLMLGCAATQPTCPPCPTCPAAAPAAAPGTHAEAVAPPPRVKAVPLAAARARRAQGKCGTERWDVKTLNDPDVGDVDFSTVVPKTISDLNALPQNCSPADPRAGDPEHTVYEVTGMITVVKPEADRDMHIAVADPNNPDKTMVVEVVDPSCPGAKTSPHLSKLKHARTMFQDLLGNGDLQSLEGFVVRVRGVGFYDRAHGQTGLSDSCLELHPVLEIELAQ